MMLYNQIRSILHIGLDALSISVERLRDKRLTGKPLIIAGRSARLVVACSDEARPYGVHPGMPLQLCRQLCPEAVVLSGDQEAYDRFSGIVTEIISEKAPVFEKTSSEAFYIDLTGMDRFVGCYRWSTDLRNTIIQETHLPLSMGLSVNKLVSQVASAACRPNGQQQIHAGAEEAFLAPLPVYRISRIGDKTVRFLHEMGITRVKTLAAMPLKMLEATFGKHGPTLWNIAHGIDNSPVVPSVTRRSLSAETLFETHTIDMGTLRAAVLSMTEQLAFQLRRQHECASCIIVHIRYSDSEGETRQKHLPHTASDNLIARAALGLFSSLYTRRLAVRQIKIRLTKLVRGNLQTSLFGERDEELRLSGAMDMIRSRYGPGVVTRACALVNDPGIRQSFHC